MAPKTIPPNLSGQSLKLKFAMGPFIALGYQKQMFKLLKTTKKTFNFFLSYIIIVIVDCCMLIDKMMHF
jgi:uncharacterized Tic20 family protein